MVTEVEGRGKRGEDGTDRQMGRWTAEDAAVIFGNLGLVSMDNAKITKESFTFDSTPSQQSEWQRFSISQLLLMDEVLFPPSL